MTHSCLIALSVSALFGSGPIKKGVDLYVADDNTVTIVDQGGMDDPGGVGPEPYNLEYLAGWGWLGGEATWRDTNNDPVLFLNHNGLDALVDFGVANRSDRISGSVAISASTSVGSSLRGNYPGAGAHSFNDSVIFENGTTLFYVSGCVAFGHADLTTESPAVSDDALNQGQEFTVSATVRNTGDGTCEDTTITFRRSLNPIITTFDTLLASRPVAALTSTNATSFESAPVTAPAWDGLFWVGACVEAVEGEPDTSDQCSPGVAVRVGPSCATKVVENRSLVMIQTIQACQALTAGPEFVVETPSPDGGVTPGVSLYGGEAVEFVEGFSVAANADLAVGSCGHDICVERFTTSSYLRRCMPCVSQICDTRSSCCGENPLIIRFLQKWDASCVERVETICGLPCP